MYWSSRILTLRRYWKDAWIVGKKIPKVELSAAAAAAAAV
jgi:hypothetical protein